MKKILNLAIAFTFATLFVACNDNDETVATTGSLTVDLTGLEALGSNYVYEGWLIVDGSPVSTGTFTSVSFPQSYTVAISDLQTASRFVLSIEPAGETGAAALAPADTKVLAGDFSGNTASVWVAPVTTDANNFNDISGKFFLRTPTDEVAGSGNNGNDAYGIWFGTPGAPPTEGLSLPTLAAGWKYEGWVVVDGVPISTGTFTSTTDRDDSNGFSGTQSNAGPPVPGEDFFLNAPTGVTFPLDVRGKTAVISIEPSPDDSPAPFAIKPLLGVSGQETAPTTHALNKNLSTLPKGTVTR
ncbi:anti-sigma factor [uncultured Polaribacter sp.]|uniref:anti-sigma factor n=1 Tax=uncultured Polaribacter sp. TaxID=174711 RepID=UPI002636267A|nr:anti-sigma factor [uncultured Polaribacter sp.]